MKQQENPYTGNETAIIGMSLRVPGAEDYRMFWENLCASRESISRFTREELAEQGITGSLLDNPHYVRAKGVIRDPECFDAAFFRYQNREAELMDPQVRILHECAWEALEDAGCNVQTYSGLIGLYAGAGIHTAWQALAASAVLENPAELFEAEKLFAKDYLAARLAYQLNFKGPSVSLYTACSTSLAAVHQAVQALLSGECDLALAGGFSLSLPVKSGYLYQPGLIESPDGHCRPFDAQAAGTVGSQGGGMVVLKLLEEALAAGDHIHAVIKGTALNNDGNQKAGFTAPGMAGQVRVIRSALLAAEVPAESITYVEAHGTGTPLGDPVEVAALKEAFGACENRRCALGSVKSNIGHLDTAAGIAGLIKTILALEHRRIPPTINFTRPNPKLGLENSPFYIAAELQEWENDRYPLRAGVTSLGLGGTNVHVILEQPPVPDGNRKSGSGPGNEPDSEPGSQPGSQLLVISARTAAGVSRQRERLLAFLKTNPASPEDIAYTLQTGRQAFTYRQYFVCSSRRTALRQLANPSAAVQAATPGRDVLFLFTPAAPGWLQAAHALYAAEPFFRSELERCLALTSRFEESPGETLFAAAASTLQENEISPLLQFCLSCSLARLYSHWGIRPAAVAGSGIHQYTAAALGGCITPRDVIRILEALEQQPDSGQPLLRWPEGISCGEGHTPLLSPDTGNQLTAQQLEDSAYWIRLPGMPPRSPGDCRETLEAASRLCLEIPPPGLSGAREHIPLELLGRLWQQGLEPGWAALSTGKKQRIVPLPAYSFEKTRFWSLPDAYSRGELRLFEKSETSRLAVEDWFYVRNWQRERLTPPPADPGKHSYLLFTDESSKAKTLYDQVKATGGEIVLVRLSGSYARSGAADYQLNPLNKEDYSRLLRELAESGQQVDTLLYYRGPDTRQPAEVTGSVQGGLFSLIYLAAAWQTVHPEQQARLVVFTTGACDVTGNETLNPAAALAGGLARVIPREAANLVCRQLDLAGDSLPAALLAELNRDPAPPLAAYRHNQHWLPVYQRIKAERAAMVLKEGGVYLITGGRGKVGLHCAAYIASRVRATLILTARRAFPARKNWPEVTDPQLLETITRIRKLEAAGSRVVLFTADAADKPAMTRCLALIDEQYLRLDGVVYAAGLVEHRLLSRIGQPEDTPSRAQFASKVKGIQVLADLLEGRPLAVCLILSSLATLTGGAGYSLYAAVNSYLNTFVKAHNRGASSRWLAVNWDGWDFREESGRNPDSSPAAIMPREGRQAWEFVFALAGRVDEIFVSTTDLPSRLKQLTTRRIPAAGSPSRTRPALSTPYLAPANALEKKLTLMWQDFLGMEQVGVLDDFFELGGDSLQAVSFLTRLEQATGLPLPAQELFTSPTIRAAAAYMEQSALKEKISADEDFLVFNREQPEKIFCFPPYLCYGFVYYELSRHLAEYSLYSFNYPGGDDPVAHYISLIKKIQEQPPYRLFAYSAGGRVAFQVARAMQEQGMPVSDLVLLDSFARWNTIREFSLPREEQRAADLLRDYSFFFGGNQQRLREAKEKLIEYARLIHHIEIRGALSCQIHLIHAQPQQESAANRDWHQYTLDNTWQPFTTARYREYRGRGTHMEMLHPEYIEENARLLKKIFREIFTG